MEPVGFRQPRHLFPLVGRQLRDDDAVHAGGGRALEIALRPDAETML